MPRRSTIQRTSSKMRHARLICTTRSVRTRDLTNWFVTLRYASFGNIERDATAAIPRRGMRTSGTNDRQCTRSSFVVSHAVRRRRRCRRRGVDRDGHHRHAARPHGRTLVGRRPIRRWRAGVSRCLVDTDIAPCPRDERRPVRCRDGRWGGRIKSAPRADDDDGKRGGGDDGVSPPPSATTATSSSSAPTSSTSPSSSSNSAWTGEYASSHAKNLRVPPHPPNCILLLAHTPWRRRKQCLRYIVVVVAAAAAAEHRKSIKYTQHRADLGRPNAMTGLTGRGGERGLLIFTSLTDDIIFEMRCGRARENYSSSEALLSLRNLKNTNSYDELLDRRPDRKTRVLRSKKADFQAGTHVGTHVRTLRHLPT